MEGGPTTPFRCTIYHYRLIHVEKKEEQEENEKSQRALKKIHVRCEMSSTLIYLSFRAA